MKETKRIRIDILRQPAATIQESEVTVTVVEGLISDEVVEPEVATEEDVKTVAVADEPLPFDKVVGFSTADRV